MTNIHLISVEMFNNHDMKPRPKLPARGLRNTFLVYFIKGSQNSFDPAKRAYLHEDATPMSHKRLGRQSITYCRLSLFITAAASFCVVCSAQRAAPFFVQHSPRYSTPGVIISQSANQLACCFFIYSSPPPKGFSMGRGAQKGWLARSWRVEHMTWVGQGLIHSRAP